MFVYHLMIAEETGIDYFAILDGPSWNCCVSHIVLYCQTIVSICSHKYRLFDLYLFPCLIDRFVSLEIGVEVGSPGQLYQRLVA